jgi:integrase
MAASQAEAELRLAETFEAQRSGSYKEKAAPSNGLKHLPDGRWQYSWTFRGRYHRVIAPTRAIAAASLGKVRAQIAEGRYLEKEVAHLTRFEDAVTRFLKWGETNVSPGTHRRDRDCAALWLAFAGFKGKTLAAITAADVEDYRTARLTTVGSRTLNGHTFDKRRAGKRTCDLDLARLRRLFSLCIKWKLTKENPAMGVDFFRPESKHDRFLTRDEETKILQACPPDLRPAMLFAVNTGLRQMELLTLTWGQVDVARKTVTLTADKTKSGRTRRVPLNTIALEALRVMPRGINSEAPVFPIMAGRDSRDLIRRFTWAVDDTKINKDATPAQRVTWHTLRHTFASRLVQSGVSLLTVKELLGHSTLVMVMRYAHLADENLKAAVDALTLADNLQTTCNRSAEGSEGGAP